MAYLKYHNILIQVSIYMFHSHTQIDGVHDSYLAKFRRPRDCRRLTQPARCRLKECQAFSITTQPHYSLSRLALKFLISKRSLPQPSLFLDPVSYVLPVNQWDR